MAKARRAGIRIGYPCRGEGVCGRCSVEILSGSERLAPPTDEERELLERERCSPRSRISCLATIADKGPVILAVGGGRYTVDL
ncbi:2Fe-2S iron-sulfur cluster-binding protein [Vulgatibacter incomptus]|uniref:2Fe-2S ferredoxin-type domain-containing protein n=1 Tax=Vulgatibacter incomptus TaxID=1391653 RepID=A0A0K1PJH7_9BACT|nr:2Fe-2S iron-sulfur cluster-binding protein [Vulgatibacter incomptus]AKU93239.1 hypothetical protein AKJ08_3626 [Vulgatibacter incomptus]